MTISSGSSAAGGEQFHVLFAVSVEGCFGDFLEQDMRLTVDHPLAWSIAATSQLVRLESHGAGIFDRRHTVFLQQGKHPQDAADAGLSLPSYMADKSESKI